MERWSGKHLVLVHGACHGAWSWYKVKPLLEESGHKVTALDMSASGIHPKQIQHLSSFQDYTLPLLDFLQSLPDNHKVILVGHSLGGLCISFAMEEYPKKISAAVFLAAFMPDTRHPPSHVIQQWYMKAALMKRVVIMEKYTQRTPSEAWSDTQFRPYFNPANETRTSMLFGPNFLSTKLYQLCSAQDVELGKMLVRRGSLFIEDLSNVRNFSGGGFGSVKRVYIVCCQDKAIPEDYQRLQIDNTGVTQVLEIKDADHMAMLSNPQQLCQCLSLIANRYD